MEKDILKDVVTNLVKGDKDAAKSDFRRYLTMKSKNMVNEASKDDDADKDDSKKESEKDDSDKEDQDEE